MTVWYPMPRSLASRLAQYRASGCKRIVTGRYRAWRPFAGRPRLGILTPSLRSMARRNISRSFSVNRRAREKSKGGFSGSYLSCIKIPFQAIRRPGAYQSIRTAIHAKGKHDSRYTSRRPVVFRDLPNGLIPSFILCRGCDFNHQSKVIVKNRNSFFKTDPVFKNIADRFINVPLELHINCMYRNVGCQA